MLTTAGKFATYAFGVAPATVLLFFAASGAYAAIGGLYASVGGQAGVPSLDIRDVGTALRAVLFTVAAVLAGYGYVALLHAARDTVTPRVAWRLGAGIVANVIGVGLLMREPEWLSPSVAFLLFSPLLVGCAHLARFIVRTTRRRARSRPSTLQCQR
jgi:hypothetical protein